MRFIWRSIFSSESFACFIVKLLQAITITMTTLKIILLSSWSQDHSKVIPISRRKWNADT